MYIRKSRKKLPKPAIIALSVIATIAATTAAFFGYKYKEYKKNW